VLHVSDRRARYDVMTSDSAELYVNVFHLHPLPSCVRGLLNEVAAGRAMTATCGGATSATRRQADQQLPRYSRIPGIDTPRRARAQSTARPAGCWSLRAWPSAT
jgi:hypothetical protein